MPKEVRIGVIGTGVGVRTHIPGFRSVEGAKILAISGSCQDRSEKFATELGIPTPYGDFHDLCESDQIDLVCVTSPTEFHCEHATFAISCGKHVLCEKPLALTMPEIESMARCSHGTEKICVVDHQLRFNPYIHKVRQILRKGDIGRPYFVRIHQQSTSFANRNAPWNWSFDVQHGGGVRLAMGSHFIDLLNYWFGKQCLNVRCALDSVVSKRYVDGIEKKVDVSGFFSASLAWAEGLDVQLSATAASCGTSRFDFSIFGEEGELHFDLDSKLRGALLPQNGVVQNIPVEGVLQEELSNKISFFAGTFRYFAPLLVRAVASDNRELIADASRFDDAIFTQRLLDAMLVSALKGRTVEISEGYKAGALL